ncbi:amidohydrolase [Cupriavidus sp. IK-TO18]|uniref:amidohydrolase family protein n=1 Tax=Cupriavidus sp. IK-TO18 TaxID=2782182 RepID=UPI00189B4A92|nr:amidohydrolase family protein [Cupriavidus sp. IK-TO18]MBF6989153.1 amidohydrolase family protein [Cupriavidus sp. IK-TO18]
MTNSPSCARTAPDFPVPAGATDCHCHVFGPYGRFPLEGERTYTPPEYTPSAYLRLLDSLHLNRGVLVQPSAHGLDNRAMLHALAAAPDRLRGVAVVDPSLGTPDLRTLAAQGVCGLRFSRLLSQGHARYKNAVDVRELHKVLPALRELGMHVQLWSDIDVLVELEPLIRASRVPFVLDHMGRVDPNRGIDDPRFSVLLSLLAEGLVWVKLTPYRVSAAYPDYEDIRPFHDRLLATNPEQLVWGSDWPHVNMAHSFPDAGHLLNLLSGWTPDRAQLEKILVHNPAALYGF